MNAPWWRKLMRWLRYRRVRKERGEALMRLATAIGMPRQEGRIDAIRKAWDAYLNTIGR
jgi:hypothetical protein